MVWVVSLSVIAVIWPRTMLGFVRPRIFGSLAGSMLGIGRTLGIEDFRRTGNIPSILSLGFFCQYTSMPLHGWGVAKLLGLETCLAVGIILVASCPGDMAPVRAWLGTLGVMKSIRDARPK